MKIITNCEKCGKIFESYNKNPRFCSVICKAEFNRYPIDDSKVKKLYLSGLTQQEVAEKLNVTRKIIEKSLIRTKTPKRKAIKRNQWGENNHMWKGDQAGYSCLHKRLHRRFGKAQKCEICGTTDKRKSYDYANLTGKYKDINDYKQMCRSCHWKHDKKINNIKKMREVK